MFSLGGHDHLPKKSFQIKQDDKFFSRLLSKESSSSSSSKAESSFRVLYYGGASGAVPFMWESQPGTPKHQFSDTSLPPLTPPPSYQFSPKTNKSTMQKPSKPSNFLFTIFPRIASKKNPPSLSSSSISSSCSSGSFSSPMMNQYTHRRRCFSSSRSTVHFGVDQEGDDEQQADGSPTSTLCFSVRHVFSKEFRGSRSKVSMK